MVDRAAGGCLGRWRLAAHGAGVVPQRGRAAAAVAETGGGVAQVEAASEELAAMRWAQDYYLLILGATAFTAATIGTCT